VARLNRIDVGACLSGPMAVQSPIRTRDGSGRSRPPRLRLLSPASRTVFGPDALRSVKQPKSEDSSRSPPLLCRRPTRLPGGGSRTAHRLRCDVARWTYQTSRSKLPSIRFDRAIERLRSMLSCLGTASVCETWQRLIEASSRLDHTRPSVSANRFRTMRTEESFLPACTRVRLTPCPVESDAISRPERPLQSHFCEASRRLDGRLPELPTQLDRASSVGRL
jgi:hypothetical protein